MDQGQSGAIQVKELRPSLHLGVVAIQKGAFGSLSTKGRQLYFYLFQHFKETQFIYNKCNDHLKFGSCH